MALLTGRRIGHRRGERNWHPNCVNSSAEQSPTRCRPACSPFPPPWPTTSATPAATSITCGCSARLTANWSMDAWGITFRETYYGPQKGYSSPGGGVTLADYVPNGQSGVGLTDLELRYNVTEQLGLAIGGNNIFSIRQNTGPTWMIPALLMTMSSRP